MTTPSHPLRTIQGVDVRSKRVLVRIDADVDLGPDGQIEPEGDHRLRGCLPTLRALREGGARLILLSHLGRPGGTSVPGLQIAQVANRLADMLGVPIQVLSETVGPRVRDAVLRMRDQDILFLENVRFDPREEQNDQGFAQELAALGELYVNEAFAAAHRAHASLVAITEFLPSYAGLLLAKEVDTLQRVFEHPERPIVAVVSGAKLETKITLLQSLLPRVDRLLTGGGIANMFLSASGSSVGVSLAEPSLEGAVRELWATYRDKISVPVDVRVAPKGDDARPTVVSVEEIGEGDRVYDIGPLTTQQYCAFVSEAKTCIWNGPLGKVELTHFQEGTRGFGKCLQRTGAYTVVGGGDTVTALSQMHLVDGFDHVSSGGGALIAFLEGAPLPAVDALRA